MWLKVSRTLRGANRFINFQPIVRLVAKLIGPGPNRLRMVKLSHQLGDNTGEDDGRAV